MDLQDQLRHLFPEHVVSDNNLSEELAGLADEPIQKEPLCCHYEKRKGKPVTRITGFIGSDELAKSMAKEIKVKWSVGGTFKDGEMLFQGDFRQQIMAFLQQKGFQVKRVGG
jgi:translation initiation factor 1